MTAAIEPSASEGSAHESGVRRLVRLLDSGTGGRVGILLDGEAASEDVTPLGPEPDEAPRHALYLWRRWLVDHPRTGSWPTLGAAGEGWRFPGLVREGGRVCPLMAAVATENRPRALAIVSALDLPHAPQSWRQHAGELAIRMMRSAERLTDQRDEMLDVVAALMMQGAELDDELCLQEAEVAAAQPADRADASFIHTKPAPLTSMILRAELQPLGAQVFTEILKRHPERAVQWRDCTQQGASAAHLCVKAGRPQALVALLEIPGMADQVDRDNVGLLAYAQALGQAQCVGVLRAHAARQEAAAVLDGIERDDARRPAARSQ